MFTFLEMPALVESESSFGAYVCHRRPGGSTATSDLVFIVPTHDDYKNFTLQTSSKRLSLIHKKNNMTRGPDESEQDSKMENRREKVMATVAMVLSRLWWLRICTYIDKTQTPHLLLP